MFGDREHQRPYADRFRLVVSREPHREAKLARGQQLCVVGLARDQAVERDLAVVVPEIVSHAETMAAVWAANTGGLLRDADVLLHAIADALLGALALGDIGKHFPDTDPAFKGADSMKLLEQVVGLISAKGYAVGNLDATIIAQRPKMAPHIQTMQENIARACGVEVDRINVKATTEEGLGFTGTGEGISAHAVVLLTPK